MRHRRAAGYATTAALCSTSNLKFMLLIPTRWGGVVWDSGVGHVLGMAQLGEARCMGWE